MKDGGSLVHIRAREPGARLRGAKNEHFDPPAMSFLDHVRRDRQPAVDSRPDEQPAAVPGQGLGRGQRRVAVSVALWLRGLLAAAGNPAVLDQDIVVVRPTVDLNETEGDQASLQHLKQTG